MKKYISGLLCLLLLFSFCACSQNADTDSPTAPAQIVYPDGLSPDKTFYQLTDKDGVVVRIPIGRSVSSGFSGYTPTASANEDHSVTMYPLSHQGGDVTPCSSDGIYVFSEYSVISFGYGDAIHPVTGEKIYLDSGSAYSVPEKYILIIQFTDKDRNSVPKDSDAAHVINIFVLDYKTEPGSFYFMETAEVQCSDNRVLYYNSRDTVEQGAITTEHVIWTHYDEFEDKWYTYYSIQISQEVDTYGCTHKLTYKEMQCASDWTVLYIDESTYDENYNLETMTRYRADGTLMLKTWYNGSGIPVKEEEYDENGVLINTYFHEQTV